MIKQLLNLGTPKTYKDRLYIYQSMNEVQAQINEAEKKREEFEELLTKIATVAAYIAIAVSAIGFPMFFAAMMGGN